MLFFINHEDKNITYVEKFREYGIPVCDGGDSYITIGYCPWCSKKLPSSLREEWFDLIDNLGFEDPNDEQIPIEYKTDTWWRQRKIDDTSNKDEIDFEPNRILRLDVW
jgi:hypothetical protein